jgi:phosphoribosyl 1,2-cyclic phosphodiesterase
MLFCNKKEGALPDLPEEDRFAKNRKSAIVSTMFKFCPLASGSKGNCLLVATDKTRILIDAGLSLRQLSLRLAEIGLSLSQIDAIVLTHEHADHISGLEPLVTQFGLPVFANAETAKALCEILGYAPKFKIFSTEEPFAFGQILFSPFSLPHDAADPVGFTLLAEGIKLGICADLGFVSSLVKTKLRDCDILYVEANHERERVHACSRPILYKQRVLGRQGHLSNQECAELLATVLHSKLRQIYLAHLSSECNSPDLALDVVTERLAREGPVPPLVVAHQDRVSLCSEA